MPTHNAADYLSEVLESIAIQSWPINELIISDDESEDETLNIVQNFSQRANFSISVLKHKRSGVTKNYLNALGDASGDIVLIADQDDLWLQNKVFEVVTAFSDKRVSVVCHDCLLVDDELQSLNITLRGNVSKSKKMSNRINNASDEENLKRYLKGGLPLLAHSMSIRASIIPDLLNKPESIEQWWFEEWVALIAMTQGRLHFVPQHLVLYRQHDQQTSGGFEHSSILVSDTQIREHKYSNRITKIKYCQSLISDQPTLSYKHSVFSEYTKFLLTRQDILSSMPLFKSLMSLSSMLVKSEYHSHANGLLSFGLDVFSRIKFSLTRMR